MEYLVECLRDNIEQFSFSHAQQCTASFGVGAVRADDSVETLVERADRELYRAKNIGRNRVCSS